MDIEVYWTEFAERKLQRIFEYYKEVASHNVAKNLINLINSIYSKVDTLKNQPEIGQIEELLSERQEDFRYLVFKSYKIIIG